MRIVAVDWSGREVGASETIWIAEVFDRRLTFLENGRDRGQVVDWLDERRTPRQRMVVGLDFAFSFPDWYCAQQGWTSGPDAWAAMTDERIAALVAEEFPFWGRSRGRPPELGPDGDRSAMRATDALLTGVKSIFQVGGAGAVGTGSLRGMPALRELRRRGFAVWPFDDAAHATVVEIYPRRLYPDGLQRMNKSRWHDRHSALMRSFPRQPRELLERAAGSEDAFDAAVSALRMARHATALRRLAPAPDARVEGRVWTPATPER